MDQRYITAKQVTIKVFSSSGAVDSVCEGYWIELEAPYACLGAIYEHIGEGVFSAYSGNRRLEFGSLTTAVQYLIGQANLTPTVF